MYANKKMTDEQSYLIEKVTMSITNDTIDALQFHHMPGIQKSIMLA